MLRLRTIRIVIVLSLFISGASTSIASSFAHIAYYPTQHIGSNTSRTASTPQFSLSGWFHVTWVDRFVGSESATVEYGLIDDSGRWTAIQIDESLIRLFGDPLTLNRKRVVVTGELATIPYRIIQARSIGIEKPEDASTMVAGTTPLDVTGPKPWVTILCRFADSTNVTPHEVNWYEGLMGTQYPGMDHYWRELSYQMINLTGSLVVGWYNLPDPRSEYLLPDSPWDEVSLNKMFQDCTAVADGDIYFPDFYGVNVLINQDVVPPCTAWAGSRTLTIDGQTRQYEVTWEQPSCQIQSVLGHEIGHGFGLPHSSGPYDQTYDSQWDVMSGGGTCSSNHVEYGCVGVHTIAYHKDQLGWIPSGRKYVAVSSSNQTITIERLGQPVSSTNYLMAEISIGGSPIRFYTVEARRSAGYDDSIPGEAIVIHEVDTTRFVDRSNRVAYVIDVDNNGDPNDAGARWQPGESFIDATYGITVSVNSTTGSGFQVNINVAPISPFVTCASQTQIPTTECQALVALYNSGNGTNWTNRWGWLSNPWPCLWHGITCGAGHVTAIRLSNNQLTGTIPTELGNLLNLQTLDLSSNELIGGIPSTLLNLTALRELNLGFNQLSGSIPAGFGNLTSLEVLTLWSNQLTGSIPPNLGNLTNLRYLLLNDNQLTGNIPPQLGNLVNLLDLGLWGNQLTGSIPPELGNLVNLIGMYLGGNQLSGSIPRELGNLTTYLRSLDLQYNQLSGSIPPELGNLTALQQLYLYNNQLSGSIPLELTNLANLTSFWFNNTYLCEPADVTFQAWLASIPDVNSTDLICGTEFIFLPTIAH